MRPLTAALVLENQSFRERLLEALKGVPVRILLDQAGFGAWHLVLERLERLEPDLVFVDLAGPAEQRFSYITQIRAMSRPAVVVVIHDSDDAQVILSALRAGAAEFLTLPFEKGAFSAAVERISTILPSRPGRESGGRLLAFLAAKGGAGATTLACNVSAAIGKTIGKEVLLADLDMETGNVAFAMKAHTNYSILDACRNINRLDAHYWKGLVSNGQPNLSILTAPGDLRGLEPPQGVEVRQVLRFARTVYDFTIVDLASSLNRLTLAALEEADRIFLITSTELPSLHLAKRALQSLSQVGYALNRVDLVLNRISRRDEVMPTDVERNLGVPVFWSFPEDHDSANEFYVKGGLISAKSGLGKSIRQFVEKIPGVKPETVGKKKSFLGS